MCGETQYFPKLLYTTELLLWAVLRLKKTLPPSKIIPLSVHRVYNKSNQWSEVSFQLRASGKVTYFIALCESMNSETSPTSSFEKEMLLIGRSFLTDSSSFLRANAQVLIERYGS